MHDLLNDENNDQNESQYNLITNYDYPINIYYNKTAIKEYSSKEVLLISIIGENKDQDGDGDGENLGSGNISTVLDPCLDDPAKSVKDKVEARKEIWSKVKLSRCLALNVTDSTCLKAVKNIELLCETTILFCSQQLNARETNSG